MLAKMCVRPATTAPRTTQQRANPMTMSVSVSRHRRLLPEPAQRRPHLWVDNKVSKRIYCYFNADFEAFSF